MSLIGWVVVRGVLSTTGRTDTALGVLLGVGVCRLRSSCACCVLKDGSKELAYRPRDSAQINTMRENLSKRDAMSTRRGTATAVVGEARLNDVLRAGMQRASDVGACGAHKADIRFRSLKDLNDYLKTNMKAQGDRFSLVLPSPEQRGTRVSFLNDQGMQEQVSDSEPFDFSLDGTEFSLTVGMARTGRTFTLTEK